MDDAKWLRSAVGFFLSGLLTVGTATLAMSVAMPKDVMAVLTGARYALLLGTLATAATEYSAASTTNANADMVDWMPETEAAVAAVSYVVGAAVPVLAGVSSSFHPGVIAAAIVVGFAGAGYCSAKIAGRTATAGAIRVAVCCTIALAAGYYILLEFPHLFVEKIVEKA